MPVDRPRAANWSWLMKCVFTSPDPLMVEQVRTALESVGVDCVVQRSHLRPLAGTVPFTECWPEVWIVDDEQSAAAEALVRRRDTPERDGGAWACGVCGQKLGKQFTACWRCEGRSAHAVELEERRRIGAAYPRIVLWLVLACLTGGVYAVLRTQLGTAP
ncbi:MAG: DUF2007 domain-containing protein [Candidatus Binatia bacterium]